jgi:prophage maintenance system killer protein
MSEVFLTYDELLQIHKEVMKPGQNEAVASEDVLDRIVDYPKEKKVNGEYVFDTIFKKAATYTNSVAVLQPYVDGNLRESLASALIFLRMNGRKIRFGPDDELDLWVDEIKDGDYSIRDIAAEFEKQSRPGKSKSFKEAKAWFFEKYRWFIDGAANLS